MKKKPIYRVKPEWLYGSGNEGKREAQLALLSAHSLSECSDGYVYCDADVVLSLFLGGYSGQYFNADHIQKVADVEAGPDVGELFDILSEKLLSAAPTSFNGRCQQQQPNQSLLNIAETKLLENSCTDALQQELACGWRILAVQPQPDQRRPDYILGRPQMYAQRA